MMKTISVLLLLFALSSCTTTSDISSEYKENPCMDPEYQRLKSIKITEMTGAESEYYKQKEKECSEFENMAENKKSKSDLVLISVLIGSLAAASMFLFLFSQH